MKLHPVAEYILEIKDITRQLQERDWMATVQHKLIVYFLYYYFYFKHYYRPSLNYSGA